MEDHVHLLAYGPLMHEAFLRSACGAQTPFPLRRSRVVLSEHFVSWAQRAGPSGMGEPTLLDRPARTADPCAEGVLWTLPEAAIQALDASQGTPLQSRRQRWHLHDGHVRTAVAQFPLCARRPATSSTTARLNANLLRTPSPRAPPAPSLAPCSWPLLRKATTSRRAQRSLLGRAHR